MTSQQSASEEASFEIYRLLQALEALTNPACCRGAVASVFQVLDQSGKPTGEEVRLCNECRNVIQAF